MKPRPPAPARRVAAARRLACWSLLAAGTMLVACNRPRDPIIVGGGMVVLENQTAHEWRNVVVTVNDHFRGGTPVLLPGGRMTGPLRDFRTAFGQRFDRGRQSVFKVEVTATDATGAPVRLTWDGKRIVSR
ncbi:MAG TPA: hypothetical protein VD833_03265 [Vicinamibacterales bacterium]|nr:hypothetical protein [Vicinamibacterales bacterium]